MCCFQFFFVATTVRLLLQSSRMGPFTQNMMLMTPPGVCDAYRVLLCILIDTSFQLLLMDKKIKFKHYFMAFRMKLSESGPLSEISSDFIA